MFYVKGSKQWFIPHNSLHDFLRVKRNIWTKILITLQLVMKYSMRTLSNAFEMSIAAAFTILAKVLKH